LVASFSATSTERGYPAVADRRVDRRLRTAAPSRDDPGRELRVATTLTDKRQVPVPSTSHPSSLHA